MQSIQSLFALIQTLTKTEKRYLALQASFQAGDKLYMQLYDWLEAAAFLDENLQRTLRNQFPGNKLESARKHLDYVLMKTLRQFEAESWLDARLMNLIHDSAILFRKGLFTDCFAPLDKAKRLALRHERFSLYVLAARQELQFHQRRQFIDIDESALLERQESLQMVLTADMDRQHHTALYNVLSLRYWQQGPVRTRQDINRLNDLLLEEHQLLRSQRLRSFDSQQVHLHFQSIYFQMTGQPDGSLPLFRELDDLYRQYPHLWSDTPVEYVQVLNDILFTLRYMEQYEPMTYFLDRLGSLAPQAGGLTVLITYLILEHQLHRALAQGQTETALQLLQTHLTRWERERSQLPIQTQTQLALTVSRVWYESGRYTEALRVINGVLNQTGRDINRYLYASCRLMHLFIHVALDNRDYIDYQIRSAGRMLKGDSRSYQTERLVLNVLKKWIAYKPLSDLTETIQTLRQDVFERQFLLELSLESWFSRMAVPNNEILR